MKDYVEEAKRYNAQRYSNVCDTRRHRDQVEAMVEKVVPFAHEPLAHEKETGHKEKEQDSTWKSEAPGMRFTATWPEPINEENSAKQELAGALEATRNITRLYNEMAETADNRTEAIREPASTGNVSPFVFYSSQAGHINLPEPQLPSHSSAKELPEAANRLLDIGTTVGLGGVPLKLPRTLPVRQMSLSLIQPPIPTAVHSHSSNAVPVQALLPPPAQPDTFVGNAALTTTKCGSFRTRRRATGAWRPSTPCSRRPRTCRTAPPPCSQASPRTP